MDKRISKTYDALLRAFFKLLRNHPYDELTVLDICEEAKIQRPTFYNNFSDKRDFVEKIMMWEFEQIIIREAISQDIYFEDFVILLLKGYIRDLDFNRKDPVFLRTPDTISCLFKIAWNVEQKYFKEKYAIMKHKKPNTLDIDTLMYEYAGFFNIQAHYYYYHNDINMQRMWELIDNVKSYALF